MQKKNTLDSGEAFIYNAYHFQRLMVLLNCQTLKMVYHVLKNFHQDQDDSYVFA